MSRTVLVEADLSLKESAQGATEQTLAPASTALKGLSLEARAECWVPIEDAAQLGGGLREILRAMHSAWEPLAEVREAMQQQIMLPLLGGPDRGVLDALGAVGGMGGLVGAAADLGALGSNSAELLRAITAPSAHLESGTLRALADFGTLERMQSFVADIAAPWPAPGTRAPAVPRTPEPPAAEIAEVHLPGERWAEVITGAIRGGKVTKAAMIKLIMSMPDEEKSAPGLKPPQWEEIEAVALLYKEHGHKYDDQERFVRYYLEPKGMALSVQTFRRWIKRYESVTGERISPGRGSRKRKALRM